MSQPTRAGWLKMRLEDFVKVQRGYDLPDADRHPGIVPVIGSAGITGYHDTARAKGPGVTIGRSGASFGHVTYSPVDFWPHNAVLFVTDFCGNDELFSYYFLSSIDFDNYNSGSAQPSLNRNIIYLMDVEVPPLSVQHRIASILSAYDDLIENNTQRIKALEAAAQALYREWFVEFRFPGWEDVEWVERLPEGWTTATLGEIAKINAASLKANTAPEHINYIDIASVSVGHIDAIQPMSFLEAPGRARRIVQHGDIIWSCVRPNRRSYAIIINPVDNLTVSTGFATITPVHIPYSYLYYALTTEEFVEYLVNHATGSAYPAVSQGDFENAQVLLPPTGLVEQFQNTVADMFGLQHTLSERNRTLRETRDLLLPRLISGELSVEELPLPEEEEKDE